MTEGVFYAGKIKIRKYKTTNKERRLIWKYGVGRKTEF